MQKQGFFLVLYNLVTQLNIAYEKSASLVHMITVMVTRESYNNFNVSGRTGCV